MKKIFLLSLLLLGGVTLFPSPTFAGVDQRCWTKSKCIEARSNSIHFADQKPEDGFVQNAETLAACGKTSSFSGKKEPAGFCLPVGTTETKISFGGKRKFSDIADFIRYMYRYSIMAAGIISVLMIIVAGAQWSLSGGNTSTIESARKRINGALMGLTIAMLSYSVLNFVNPNLVNFRLPAIWLINTVQPYGKYCDAVPADKRLSLLLEDVGKSPVLSSKEIEAKYATADFTIETKNAVCKSSYFIQDGGGLACLGTVCETGNVCDTQLAQCKPGVIIGTIFNSNPVDKNQGPAGLIFGDWIWQSGAVLQDNTGWIVDGLIGTKEAMQLVRICNGDFKSESSFNNMASVKEDDMKIDINKKEQYYTITMSDVPGTINKAKENCSTNGGLKGFMLEVGMHEVGGIAGGITEVHFLGKQNGNALDLGDSDAIGWVLGQSPVQNLLITPEDLLKGLIIDIDVANVFNNEDDKESLAHYKNTFK